MTTFLICFAMGLVCISQGNPWFAAGCFLCAGLSAFLTGIRR